MEEILDFEELNEDIVDENLKDFMKKDEETEKLLNDKINELASLEEQLINKENELKTLDESNREKISTNASADELIKIGNEMKEVEEELSNIKVKIEKLSKEKEEIVETKDNINKSKKEYIKSLKSASLNYDTQLRKIAEAIEVCDNPTLKQVLADVQTKRSSELSVIEEKRVSELRNILKEEEPVKEEKVEIDVPNVDNSITLEKEDNVVNSNIITNNVIENNNVEPSSFASSETNIISGLDEVSNVVSQEAYSPKSLDDLLLNTEFNTGVNQTTQQEEKNDSNVINIDEILTVPNNNLNEVKLDDIVIPNVDSMTTQIDDKIKIIYKKDVSNNLLKEIYSSSKIMPSLYSYLEGSSI